MFAPGDIFEGRYLIVEQVGEGGFARVFRARQVGTERDVALKLMSAVEEAADEAKARAAAGRFDREVRSMSLLRSPYTVTLYDFGVTASGQRYMVSEFIDGPSLQALIAARGALPPAEALRYLCQLCLSLKEAHARGILHRDIKPGNIMLQEQVGVGMQAKLLDFGIAKSMGSKQTRDDITADATLLGTIRYMSPEQLRNKTLDPASDIYSLGLVFWEMLLGNRWCDSDDNIELITLHLEGVDKRLPRPSGLAKPLEALLLKMVATSRAARLQSADEVLAAVQAIEHIEAPALIASISGELPVPSLAILRADSAEDALLDELELIEVDAPPARPPALPTPAPTSTPAPTRHVAPNDQGFEEDDADALPHRGHARGKRLIALAAALLAGIVGVGLVAATRDQAPLTPPAAAAAPAAPATPAADDAPAPARWAVEVLTEPAGMTVWINGQERGLAPLTLQLEAADFPAEISARDALGTSAAETIQAPAARQLKLVRLEDPKEAERKQRQLDARKKPKRAKVVAIDEL